MLWRIIYSWLYWISLLYWQYVAMLLGITVVVFTVCCRVLVSWGGVAFGWGLIILHGAFYGQVGGLSGFAGSFVPPLSLSPMWSICGKLKRGDVLRLTCDLSTCLGLATYRIKGCSLWQWWVVPETASCHIPHCSPREAQGILENIQPCRDMASVYSVGMPVK